MANETDEILSKPLQGFKRIHQEYCKLVDDPTNGRPYRGGACLTPSDIAAMKIVFDEHANTAFWEPSDPETKRALAGGLEESFSDLETLLNETTIYKEKLTKRRCPTIANAYTPSTQYHKILQNSVYWGLLHNEALVDASGDQLFQELCVDYIWSHIYMESRMVYSSLGHPHITILSIQPQRAPSREDLLCTEVWTLSYWAHKLARRVLRTTKYSLPIRLVSLCGYEARVVSAVFNLGYLQSIGKDMGHGPYRSAKCQLHIAEYRDLSVQQNFQDLVEDLAASPCGNVELQQKSPGRKHI